MSLRMPEKALKNGPKQPILAPTGRAGVGGAAGTVPAGSMDDGLAVYVHWPWCLQKCPYCDFNSHAATEYPREAYILAVCRELSTWRERLGRQKTLSVFFGGGTPSLMKGSEISQILTKIDELFGLPAEVEITAEFNPTSAREAVFADFAAAGVNRFSVGVQGLSAENLAFLGRAHDKAQALLTLENALKSAKNVSADLIFGLPGQDLGEWMAQLQAITGLGLTHLSCYQLTIEPHTAFFSQVRRGQWQPLDADRQADFMEATRDRLLGAGYDHYETSNYAKPGLACHHNQHVWRYGNYLGVGAGAHGRVMVDGQRLATRVRKDPADYVARMKEQNSALVEEDVIAPAMAWREAVMMGLRLSEGIDLERLEKVIHTPASASGLDMRQMGHLQAAGLLWQKGAAWGVAPKGLFVLDSILEAIFQKPV